MRKGLIMGLGLFSKKKSMDEYAEEGNALFDEEKYAQAIKVWLEGSKSINKLLNARSEAVEMI